MYVQCYWLYYFHQAATGGVLLEKVFLEILQKFTGKHFWQSLFFNKVVGTASDLSFSCLWSVTKRPTDSTTSTTSGQKSTTIG